MRRFPRQQKSAAFSRFLRTAIGNQRGLTLIEMIIVVAIVATVSTILLFNYSGFSTNVSLRNLAQEIALSVRKAQTYATSVQSVTSSGTSSDKFPSYGISFSADATTASGTQYPTSRQFVLFVDVAPSSTTPGDGKYTDNSASCGSPGVNDECLEKFSILSSDRIISVCYDGTCFDDGDNARIDVTFQRPSPDAEFCIVQGSTNCTPHQSVAITIRSAKGLTRVITVYNTGQISVN